MRKFITPIILLAITLSIAACQSPKLVEKNTVPVAIAEVSRAWIDAPLDGAILPLAPYPVVFHGADAGQVAQIELRIDDEIVAVQNNADPQQHLIKGDFLWTPDVSGIHLLQARTQTADGKWSDTAKAMVTIIENTATPTDTPLPPTATPPATTVPATDTPIPTDTATPENTPTAPPAPTDTPLPPTATAIPPTDTPVPPSPTPIPPTATATPLSIIPIVTIVPSNNPQPISPKDNVEVFCDSDVTLQWSAGSGAPYEYIVEFDFGGGNFSEIKRDTTSNTDVQIFTAYPKCGAQYRWRVRRNNGLFPGQWSDNAYFVVKAGGIR